MPLGISNLKETDLKRYLSEISAGDEEALEQFYDEYGRLLLALIFSIVKNRESAEEALQDVLMAIVRRQPDKPIDNVCAWLFKVTENISIKKAAEDKSMQTESLPENEDIIDEHSMENDLECAVDQIEAIQILDEFEQQVLIMCVFGEMKLTQVAGLLNLPYDKVRSKYDYAIRKLKKFYKERRELI